MRWDNVAGRDRMIFGMAQELGIKLSATIDPASHNAAYIDAYTDQAEARYLWLGNRIFNDGISDPNQLRALFYGGVAARAQDGRADGAW